MEEKKEVLEQEKEKKNVAEQVTASTQAESGTSGKRASGKKNGLARHVAYALIAVLLVGGVGTSIGMSAWMMNTQAAQNEKVSKFIDDERARQAEEAAQESTYQEDGYKVMDKYEIRSTTQISDAYLNNDPSGLSDEDKETYDMAKAVLDEIITDGMSAYEKELAIYDWMVDNIGQGSGHIISMPGQNSESFTPRDVLLNHNAVCVGYATTFRLLANMEGMEVHIVHNDSHSWDMVKLDDGEWYQLDIYSDVNGSKYRNFNMTDEQARNGHEWDDSALPEAKGTKYSYAVQSAVEVKDLFEIPAKVRDIIKPGKSGSLFYKFPKKLTDKDLSLADQMIQIMQQAMYSVEGGDNKDLSASWVDDGEGGYVLAIYVSDYSGNSETSIGDADPKKVTEMTNKINELFGSQVMDPNDAGGHAGASDDGIDGGVGGEAVPLEGEGNAMSDSAQTSEIIGGSDAAANVTVDADGATATFEAGN